MEAIEEEDQDQLEAEPSEVGITDADKKMPHLRDDWQPEDGPDEAFIGSTTSDYQSDGDDRNADAWQHVDDTGGSGALAPEAAAPPLQQDLQNRQSHGDADIGRNAASDFHADQSDDQHQQIDPAAAAALTAAVIGSEPLAALHSSQTWSGRDDDGSLQFGLSETIPAEFSVAAHAAEQRDLAGSGVADDQMGSEDMPAGEPPLRTGDRDYAAAGSQPRGYEARAAQPGAEPLASRESTTPGAAAQPQLQPEQQQDERHQRHQQLPGQQTYLPGRSGPAQLTTALPAPADIADSKVIAAAQATLRQQLLATAARLEGELAQLNKAAQVGVMHIAAEMRQEFPLCA